MNQTRSDQKYCQFLDEIDSSQVHQVGGKNAYLGEIIQKIQPKGVQSPKGIAITAQAYWDFLSANNLNSQIDHFLEKYRQGKIDLQETGQKIRNLFLTSRFPENIALAIQNGYQRLSNFYGSDQVDVAVRSSATAEDLPEASFAGQQDSFLNVQDPDSLLEACRKCYASLYTDRAISYREQKGFEHLDIALCLSIQKMIRADKAGAGVLYTTHKESGFPDIIVLTASWGLGENVVKGMDNPDIFLIYKPFLDREDCLPIIERLIGFKKRKIIYSQSSEGSQVVKLSSFERKSFVLKDQEILKISHWACLIENHFQRPMDIEWAKDGDSEQLYVIQARPITDISQRDQEVIKAFRLKEEDQPILIGTAIGEGIAAGDVCLVQSRDDIHKFESCPVIVSEMANTFWLPVMQQQGTCGLITDFGGPNSHAATISRELGIPAVLGTQKATRTLKFGQEVTIVCRKGSFGLVYNGIHEHEQINIHLNKIPSTKTKVRLNISNGPEAFQWWQLPNDGIGIVEVEFIFQKHIRIHPQALLNFDQLSSTWLKNQVQNMTKLYQNKKEYFIDTFSSQIGKIAASQYPKPVIVQLSAMSGQDYRVLIGGSLLEPKASDQSSLKGASRYLNPKFQEMFKLQLEGIRQAREKIGFDNIQIMIPYCQTLQQAKAIQKIITDQGLSNKDSGFKVHLSCDLSSNLNQAKDMAKIFDGLSLNFVHLPDLLQELYSLDSIDQDQGLEKTKILLEALIEASHEHQSETTIRGWDLEEYKQLIPFLVQKGLDCLSVPPEAFPQVKDWLHQAES